MFEWLADHFIARATGAAPAQATQASQTENKQEDIHSLAVHTRCGAAASIVGIVANLALCISKGAIGILSGSVSIVADATNNLSDASSNIISLVGFKLASRPADSDHPYGHGRYEYLSALVVATLVTAIGIELLISSIRKILHPEPAEFSIFVVVVLCMSNAVKLWLMAFNRSVGRRINSSVLEAAAIDARNDVISTTGVLVAAAISAVCGIDLDGWAGAGVGLFIVVSGLNLVRDTISPLLGQAPDPKLVAHIQNTIMSYPNVLGTHDLMVHDYGPGHLIASAHVEMPAEADPMESHDTIDNIENFLLEEGILTILHYDPIVTNDEALNTMRGWIAEHIRIIHPDLSIHDVRSVPGPTHTNVIFDVVRPHDLTLSDDELRAQVSRMVSQHFPEVVCKITVDASYIGTLPSS